MALPQINTYPKYTSSVPSTGVQFTYRPFLVKEQKILLMALESRDEKAILQSVVDTIEACTYEDIEVNELATFDVEFLFTQIRAKSVGETTDVSIKCDECEEYTTVNVPLQDIDMTVPKDTHIISLTDEFKLTMAYPSYKHLAKISELQSSTLTEGMYEMIIACLDSLQTEEDNIMFADESRKDTETFLDNLNSDQFDMIVNFIDNLPKMKYDVEFTCESCKKDNVQTLQGLNDFF
jgi:hypothetical protein